MSDVSLEKAYEIVSESVAAENVEGEVVIVHFFTGSYFSLRDSAALAWEQLSEGGSPSQLAAKISSPEKAAKVQMERFLGVLVEEEVLRETEGSPLPVTADISLDLNELVVEKYEDMQLLLLGDPIHDVESEGWPKMAEGTAEE